MMFFGESEVCPGHLKVESRDFPFGPGKTRNLKTKKKATPTTSPSPTHPASAIDSSRALEGSLIACPALILTTLQTLRSSPSTMSATMSRMLIRQSRTVIRRPAIRHSSTAQETAAKAKDAASSATSKASEGLTKVTAAAGPALAGAMSGVGGALKKVGGRTAKLVAFVECKENIRPAAP